MAKVKPKKKQKKNEIFCDPAVCDDCQYICEGDFLCDRYEEIVISDWQPSDNFLMCQNIRKKGGGDGA